MKKITEEETKKKERKMHKKLEPGAIFGDLSLVSTKKWRHSTVFALEEAAVIGFLTHQIGKMIKVIISYYWHTKIGIEYTRWIHWT